MTEPVDPRDTTAPRSDETIEFGLDDATDVDASPERQVEATRWGELDVPDTPDFEILDELGRGGMAVVYRARQVALNREVALKVVRIADSETMAARARTEVEAVAQLQHPNIVPIFGVVEHQGRLLCAYELVEGGSLCANRIEGPRQAAERVYQLALAVAYAHQRGIVHRDLKPANVLLTSDGIPKIADFGLAKRLQIDHSQTQDGSLLGTPDYMSPEQASGHADQVGPATDIYSLGAILYELLTGRPPFQADGIVELLELVRAESPAPPSQYAPRRVHADLETICLKCLEKQPQHRYATAQRLADDLGAFLDGEPIGVRPVGRVHRTWRWVQRRPLAAAVALLSVLTISLLAFGSYYVSLQAARAQRLADQRAYRTEIPLGMPSFAVPVQNPMTTGRVALGKQLFFDRRLSADNSIACSSCHQPDAGWADGRPRSIGVDQLISQRSAPTLVNAAYYQFLHWDGRATTLEEQCVKPILNRQGGMAVPSLGELIAKLNAIAIYRDRFQRVFGEQGITAGNLALAIAAFERTLVAGNSPYDRFLGGEVEALSVNEQRGMDVFFHDGHCSACHAGANFTDGAFHNIGIGYRDNDRPEDVGRGAITQLVGDRGRFRTPSLRDLDRTAPYMHDGSLATLEEVVEFYNHGGIPNPQLDEEIYPLGLSDQQKSDLIEFLRSALRSSDYPSARGSGSEDSI